MSTDFEIREAAIEEIEEVAQIHASLFAGIGETDITFKDSVAGTRIFVAIGLPQGRVLGYAAVNASSNVGHYLGWCGVRPETRRLGIGEALLSKVFENARAGGVRSVFLESRNQFVDALRLYLKAGFEIYGTYLNLEDQLMIRLRKRLEPK